MNMPDETGNSKRDTLMQVLNSAPEDSEMYESALAQLDESPEIPFYLEHVWNWFWQIHKGRTYGMSGPNAITWENILAWRMLLDIQIRPIEVEILNEIDSAYLKYISDQHKKKRKGKK